ncbi:MAG: GTP cyclohydrolase I FolE [Alphaproteobacteria bacterium]
MSQTEKPTREQAEDAVKTLIRFVGDNPTRDGLIDTPQRVLKAYEDFFAGYREDPKEILAKTFEKTDDYNEPVILKNIRLESHCEHHMVPIIGKAHIAYFPNKRIVGISKLVRVMNVYAKRLQVQETLNAQIANTIFEVLDPKGVAVAIEAEHQCMTTRGVHNPTTATITTTFLGTYKEDQALRREFLDFIK